MSPQPNVVSPPGEDLAGCYNTGWPQLVCVVTFPRTVVGHSDNNDIKLNTVQLQLSTSHWLASFLQWLSMSHLEILAQVAVLQSVDNRRSSGHYIQHYIVIII